MISRSRTGEEEFEHYFSILTLWKNDANLRSDLDDDIGRLEKMMYSKADYLIESANSRAEDGTMTAAQERASYEQEWSKLNADAGSHVDRMEQRRTEIRVTREGRGHLERLLARDGVTMKFDDKLAQEDATLDREITIRNRLASDSRRSAEAKIEKAVFLEELEKATFESARVKKSFDDAMPHFEAFASLVRQLHTNVRGLASSLTALPDPAPRQLDTIIRKLPSVLNQSLVNEAADVLGELGVGLTAQNKRPDRLGVGDAVAGCFTRLTSALDTLKATRAGSSSDRALYRCIVNIGGISGGLAVGPGEMISLLVDAPETRKLINDGAVEPVS